MIIFEFSFRLISIESVLSYLNLAKISEIFEAENLVKSFQQLKLKTYGKIVPEFSNISKGK